MSIKMSLFMVLYRYGAPRFIDLLFAKIEVPKASDLLLESQDIEISRKITIGTKSI